uniref:Uncharacterized protein n=1 Tax=Peronospora matthiolae TaxID=2874970 RepID=A0AAV1V3A2_9STRA
MTYGVCRISRGRCEVPRDMKKGWLAGDSGRLRLLGPGPVVKATAFDAADQREPHSGDGRCLGQQANSFLLSTIVAGVLPTCT